MHDPVAAMREVLAGLAAAGDNLAVDTLARARAHDLLGFALNGNVEAARQTAIGRNGHHEHTAHVLVRSQQRRIACCLGILRHGKHDVGERRFVRLGAIGALKCTTDLGR